MCHMFYFWSNVLLEDNDEYSEDIYTTLMSLEYSYIDTQQTQNICTTFVQYWTSVEDVGPTLYKSCTNVLCLLGT